MNNEKNETANFTFSLIWVYRRLNESFLWGKLRISLGLVDLSRIQSGTFFSGGPSWLGNG